jgi:curved DNA-binding protein
MTYYEILGVDRDATADNIKSAYKKLARLYHPDKKSGNTEKFQEINTAYQTLSDTVKREQYDAELDGRSSKHHFNFGPGPKFDDLMRQFGIHINGFTNGFKRHNQHNSSRQTARNQNIRLDVALNLVDTLSDQKKTLNVTFPNGSTKTIDITIPRGVQHGTTVRYTGIGDQSIETAPKGDIYVQIHVAPNLDFEQIGVDLIHRLTINCIEAMLGTEKEVTGLDGKQFRVTIPAGSQPDMKFAIPNQGLYVVNQQPGSPESFRGRLIIVLNIHIPTHLTDDQKNILRSIQPAI